MHLIGSIFERFETLRDKERGVGGGAQRESLCTALTACGRLSSTANARPTHPEVKLVNVAEQHQGGLVGSAALRDELALVQPRLHLVLYNGRFRWVRARARCFGQLQ